MSIPESIQSMEVYYDGRCAMCCTFHEWVHRQQRAYVVSFVAYQSPRAEALFSGVTKLDPERDLIVRTDQAAVFRGEEAWVLCLHSCKNYQNWARRLASPRMLPLARKLCDLIATHRLSLSKMLFNKKDRELLKMLHQMPESECLDRCSRKPQSDQEQDIPDRLI